LFEGFELVRGENDLMAVDDFECPVDVFTGDEVFGDALEEF